METISRPGVFTPEGFQRYPVLLPLQDSLGDGQREDGVVREAGPRLKKGKVGGVNGAAFVNRTDDIPCDGTEHMDLPHIVSCKSQP